MTRWTTANIPSQKGRRALVTGTGGLGYETALALARAGSAVIIAGRSPAKGDEAVSRIRAAVPGACVSFGEVDLASLSSISEFGERMRAEHGGLDLLINNAGVMVPPKRVVTADGFELQFGTNYLGHFALAAHLLTLLRSGKDTRVVSLGSVAARNGVINLSDLNADHEYDPMPVYAQSKLACVMFAFELQRRSDAAGWGITSGAAHPGVSRTDLLHNASGKRSAVSLARSALWFLFQPAAQGALPTLFAATSAEALPGGYYGPDRFRETRGYPRSAAMPPNALDRDTAAKLWAASEAMSGVKFS